MIWKLVNHFLELESANYEDKELLVYGVKELGMIFLNVLSAGIIGYLMHAEIETITFMVIYIMLRTYAGGYHAKSRIKCYVISICIVFFSIILIRWLYKSVLVILTLPFVTVLFFIYIIAPVEAEMKPLEDWEKERYKKITARRLCLTLIAYGISWSLGYINISLSIFTAGLFVLILATLGKVISIRNKRQNN